MQLIIWKSLSEVYTQLILIYQYDLSMQPLLLMALEQRQRLEKER